MKNASNLKYYSSSHNTRSSDRVQHLLNTLGYVSSQKITSCLDLGCGNGQITTEIAKILNINDVHGCDTFQIPPKFENTFTSEDPHYHQVLANHIDLPDHSIDLITCYMSIHHFENFSQMIQEIMRILKPDGLLFFREHDVPEHDNQLTKNLNELHQRFPDHSGPIHYWSRSNLKQELIRCHMVHVADSDYPPHINNKQAIYHSLYLYRMSPSHDEFRQITSFDQDNNFSRSSHPYVR